MLFTKSNSHSRLRPIIGLVVLGAGEYSNITEAFFTKVGFFSITVFDHFKVKETFGLTCAVDQKQATTVAEMWIL